MSFQSPFFFVFFGGFLLIALAATQNAPARKWWVIVLGSFVWLTGANPLAILPLLVTTTLTWLCLQQISLRHGGQRRYWLHFGIGLNLCHLFFTPGSNLGARLGVAFYSLQLIAFLVDQFEESKGSPPQFGLFLAANSAFYNITSGPLFRIESHIAQLQKPNHLTQTILRLALFRICWGLAKKTLGDILADQIDFYFSSPFHPLVLTWSVVLEISAQYYLDFSGYSDIAIGVASLLGINLPENFNLPFLATSMAEHWQRWHITMTEWVRDYLFQPLSMSKKLRKWSPTARACLALFVSLLFVGVWHGPSWNNIVWGIYNAFLIFFGFLWTRKFGHFQFVGKTVLSILITFSLGALGRVLNRTESWATAMQTFNDLIDFSNERLGSLQASQFVELTLVILVLVLTHFADWYLLRRLRSSPRLLPVVVGSYLSLTFVFLFGFWGRPFLYGL